MAAVMEARGEITRDPGMEDAALIDVTPSREVIEVEVIEVAVDDRQAVEDGDTLAELEVLEAAE